MSPHGSRRWTPAGFVAVDGFTAAGKTSFGHELAAALRRLGRPTLRACLDDFKHPWRHAREHGYDRVSGAPDNAVLAVDSVFAFRPEYDEFWDFRIWLDVDPELALARGIARDAAMEGFKEAARLHRDRYHAAELIYLSEVNPRSRADLVIDNRDFANPRLRS